NLRKFLAGREMPDSFEAGGQGLGTARTCRHISGSAGKSPQESSVVRQQNNEYAPQRVAGLTACGPTVQRAQTAGRPDSRRENWWDFGRITPAGLCLTN